MKNMIRAFNRWNFERRSINELRNLSFRELDDIGITSGDIRRLSKQGAEQRFA